MNYKDILSYHPMLTPKVIQIVTKMQNGVISKQQLHNRKAYAKKKCDLVSLLEYSIAFEIVKVLRGLDE